MRDLEHGFERWRKQRIGVPAFDAIDRSLNSKRRPELAKKRLIDARCHCDALERLPWLVQPSRATIAAMKPISKFFRDNLGAALVDEVWSRGAVDGAGRIFLRVWRKDYSHQAKRVLISDPDWIQSVLGLHERAKHIAAIETGASAYMVVCDGYWDEEAGKMMIESYQPDQVLHIASLERVDGAVYAHFDNLVAVQAIRTGG